MVYGEPEIPVRQLQLFSQVQEYYRAPVGELSVVPVGVAILEDRVHPRPVSPNYRGLCVYHEERSPSLYLKPVPNMFICYGCGTRGGPLRLVFDHAEDPFDFLRVRAHVDVEVAEDRARLCEAIEREERRLHAPVLDRIAREWLFSVGG